MDFGGFVTNSPLSTLPHDPEITLASNCIRDYYGPTVQAICDCFVLRGSFIRYNTLSSYCISSSPLSSYSTLKQILLTIKEQCNRKPCNEERERLINKLMKSTKDDNQYYNRAKGPFQSGYVVEPIHIKEAIIVLLQHNMLKVKAVRAPDKKNKKKGTNENKNNVKKSYTYSYSFEPDRARLLTRYPRYVEYAKKALGDSAAAVIEELLTNGRMSTYDIIAAAVENVKINQQQQQGEATTTTPSGAADQDIRKEVFERFIRLVQNGFIELVPPIISDDEEGDEENEFNDDDNEQKQHEPPTKKRRTEGDEEEEEEKREESLGDKINNNDNDGKKLGEDENILSLINSPKYEKILSAPKSALWRVNVLMFHETLRAMALNRLVAERYGHKVEAAGSIIGAALKFVANKKYGGRQTTGTTTTNDMFNNIEERNMFTPQDIVGFLPKVIRDKLEKKSGGIITNLSNLLLDLSKCTSPMVVMEVEAAVDGHPSGGKFEVAVNQLVLYLKDRVVHQITLDSQGEIAARIASIVQTKGHQESESIADAAMVPAKDVREVLHRLYRSKLINLMIMQQTKQHNPSNAVYLWYVDKDRMVRSVTHNISTALLNIRLRRQHEVELGKDWIERQVTGTAEDENESEVDKLNYEKFCHGLERLDNAVLQLDETLMVLKDF